MWLTAAVHGTYIANTWDFYKPDLSAEYVSIFAHGAVGVCVVTRHATRAHTSAGPCVPITQEWTWLTPAHR